jgi:hypothetical protein
LAACFVISDCKVISHFSKESKHQRFDLARIVIDTDGTGIEVHTNIYSCDYSGIKKEKKEKKIEIQETQELKKLTSTKSGKVEKMKMEQVLENPKCRKFLKAFCTREYAVENLIFYEEVKEFKELNLKERKERSENILKLFIISTEDCIYQINTTKKLINKVLERVEECPEDLFDEMVEDLIVQTLCTVYTGISKSFDFYRKRHKIFLIFPKKSKIGEKIKRIPYKSEGK